MIQTSSSWVFSKISKISRGNGENVVWRGFVQIRERGTEDTTYAKKTKGELLLERN
jgi:hypothetical protein